MVGKKFHILTRHQYSILFTQFLTLVYYTMYVEMEFFEPMNLRHDLLYSDVT